MLKMITFTITAILLALSGAGTTNAATQTSSLDDPAGDHFQSDRANNNNFISQPFFDIVHGEISKDPALAGDPFKMTLRVAAPIPETLPKPPGQKEGAEYLWLFVLDTPTIDGQIRGYPFAPGPAQARPFEYFVQFSWDGREFKAYLIDRTPLANGGTAVVTPIPGGVNPLNRTEVVLTVNPNLVGNPSSFDWSASTVVRDAHSGTSGTHRIDGFSNLAHWPN